MKTVFKYIILLFLFVTKMYGHTSGDTSNILYQISCEVPETEKQALLDLYNATDGANWKNTIANNKPWDANTPVCDWYGVTVSNGKVVTVRLSNNNLAGYIPSEIEGVSYLQNLTISGNENLSGEIPVSIGKLTNLKQLAIYGNPKLSGSIPKEIGNLTNLTRLTLNQNNLTGTLPVELGNLTKMSSMLIRSNQLTGTIPKELAQIDELWELFLDGNQLTGGLPPEIGRLSNLRHLSLSNNKLAGTIPVEYKGLIKLTYLALSNNELSGVIPSELFTLQLLEKVFLDRNNFEGSIPSGISELSNLERLIINNNHFKGKLPIINSLALEYLSIHYNEFVFSDIEEDHSSYKAKVQNKYRYSPQAKVDQSETKNINTGQSITLTTNALISTNNSYQWYKDGVAITGATSKNLIISNAADTDAGVYHFRTTNTVVNGLALERHPITLTITSQDTCGVSAAEKQALLDLYNSTDGPNWKNTIANNKPWDANTPVCDWYGVTVVDDKVTRVELVSNNLVGDIPQGVKGLTNLIKLNLETNQLTGTIPIEMGQLINLEFLSLNQNDLYGEIPIELELLGELRSLYLGHNKLTGRIPDSLSKLRDLRYLHLQGNNLSGEIPVALEELSKLTDLNLYSNVLTGTIPVELGQLLNLKSLHLDNNRLTGSIPVTLGQLFNLVDLNLYNNSLSGSIPEELGNLSNLQSLYVYNNRLSGAIPVSLGRLSNLKSLDIHSNRLTGGVPDSISKLSNLESLWIHDNELTGKIPASLVTLPKLQLVHLNNNQFVFSDLESEFNAYNLRFGSGFKYYPQDKVDLKEEQPVVIGEEITLSTEELTSSNNSYQWFKNGIAIPEATNSTLKIIAAKEDDAGVYHFKATNTIVQDLILERNPITVKVTSDTCAVSTREKQALIDFYRLTGGTGWTTTTNWLTDIPVCNWYGVTVVKGKVTGLKLSNNNLIGSISPALVELTNLQELNLSGNQLEGEIPIEIVQLLDLEQIILSNNNFSGNLPKELGQLTRLKKLQLSNNQFTGNIPVEYTQLISLEEVGINNNQLRGDIPAGFDKLIGFEIFTIFDNQFVFSEIEPIFVALQTKLGANFIYTPQAKVDQEEIITASVGEPITLTGTALTSTNNTYQWYKDDVVITGATGKNFVIAAASDSDVGVYHFIATNSVVTGLTLTRHQIQLEVGTASCEISATERQALIDIYNEANGASWVNTLANNKPWDITNPNSKVCDWYGVKVTNGKVTSLRLINNDLVGDIPSSLFQLTSLKDIQLSDNQLTGVLPVSLATLTKLQTLNLSNNTLEGEIPENIGELLSLEHVLLSNNVFIGNIPKSLGQIAQLENLQLGANQLTGSIPVELGEASNLRSLVLSNNQLSGDIPETFAQLTKLEVLRINNNQLSGSVPTGLDQFSGFRNFTIFDNQFIFSEIETTFEALKAKLGVGFIHDPQAKVDKVESKTVVAGLEVTLTSNILTSTNNRYQWYKDGVAITGATNKKLILNTIEDSDAGIYHFTATNSIVKELTIERNPITISIAPGDSCGVSAAEKQALIDFYTTTNGAGWTTNTNWLSATVPVCDWYGITVVDGKITALKLPKNNVTGKIPASISSLVHLTTLRLNDNKLSGDIPSALGEVVSLEHVYLSWNHLTGEIPPAIGKLKALRTLEAMGNQFTGNIPVELGNLTSLERLSLYRNLLTGTIPVELSGLLNLKYLSLSDNQLSGSIPLSLGNLTKLEELSLFRNQLSESIPIQLGQLSSLKHLYLNHNQLSGSIPVELGALSNLQYLWLSTNKLTNTIPSELGDLRKLQDFKANDNRLSGNIPAALGDVLSLKYLELARNQLSGPIPVQFGKLTNLQQLYLSNNQLSGRVPTALSQLTSLKHLMIDFNRFVFWNVEPEFKTYTANLTSFLYIPQAKVDQPETKNVITGQSITLSTTALNSDNNSYQWYKDGVAITGATSKDLIITNVTAADEGVYHFLATNSVIIDLTLERYPIIIKIKNQNNCSLITCEEAVIQALNFLKENDIISFPQVEYTLTDNPAFFETCVDEVFNINNQDTLVWKSISAPLGYALQLNGVSIFEVFRSAPGLSDLSIASFSSIDITNVHNAITYLGTDGSLKVMSTTGFLLNCTPKDCVDCPVDTNFCLSGISEEYPLVEYLVPQGEHIVWYLTETGGTAIKKEEFITTEAEKPAGITYWWDDTSDTVNTRTPLIVKISDNVPVVEEFQNFPKGMQATINDLKVEGDNVQWYTVPVGGTPLSIDTILEDEKTYFAEGSGTPCRASVIVSIGTHPPEGDGYQVVCEGTTLAELEQKLKIIEGSTIKWYDQQENGSELSATIQVENGVTYYASQVDIYGDISEFRKEITVNVVVVSPPFVPETLQTFYNNKSHTIADLLAIGYEIRWYDRKIGGTVYADSEELIDGQVYYAEQRSENDCPGIRQGVQVRILEEEIPELFGCEKFKPKAGDRYVVNGWVREQGINRVNPDVILFNDSKESQMFVELLNHLKNRIIDTDPDIYYIPEIYIPQSATQNLDFDPLLAYVNDTQIEERKLTVYGLTLEKDTYGHTIGFSFALNKNRTSTFTYLSPKVRRKDSGNGTSTTLTYRYPIRDNKDNMTLTFTDVRVENGQFYMISNFSMLNAGLDTVTLTSVKDNDSKQSGINPEVTFYQDEEISGYQPITYLNTLVKIAYKDADEVIMDTHGLQFKPQGPVIEGWQQVSGSFTIPVDAHQMTLSLENTSSEVNVYFDDIRFHPYDGNMKTFVYDPATQRLMSELDENNFATFYEYDAEGDLVRIKKETERGVFTIQESRSGNTKATK
ncbi:leucine-rich repeat domain-containing protein [Aquimarina sp. Aq78]|uniref:leucine-rich repeat domain-containing protein n=1 Tax=Aquimarina sp. Aq78 TaxID=1191889 RepID=UPI000D0FD949|nr:leucine-rich repeat domain-containing protein [Aquimarina sp. Aq78]